MPGLEKRGLFPRLQTSAPYRFWRVDEHRQVEHIRELRTCGIRPINDDDRSGLALLDVRGHGIRAVVPLTGTEVERMPDGSLACPQRFDRATPQTTPVDRVARALHRRTRIPL